MRKMMTKEVTKTTVKVAKLEMVNGTPEVVQLPDEILLGNVNLEKAQKQLDKKFGERVTILAVQPDTVTYELPVEKFIEIASVKVPEPKEAELQNA